MKLPHKILRQSETTVIIEKEKFTCPCCGYKTREETPPGTYEICPICFWEEDLVQEDDPYYSGGANKPSLYKAQQNFLKIGACEERLIPHVRKPTKQDIKDQRWKLVLLKRKKK